MSQPEAAKMITQAVTATESTKHRILEAAGEEFAAHGFESARVRAICRRAGVNLAAINYHFGDKEQLYQQAVFEAHRNGIDDEPETNPDDAPELRLRRFVRNFLKRVLAFEQGPSWRHDLMLREMLKPTQACARLVDGVIRPRFHRLRGILRALAACDDEKRINALCFSVIGQCLFYRTTCPVTIRLIGPDAFAQLSLDYLTDHITQVTLAGARGGAGETAKSPPVAAAAEEAP